MNVELPSKFEDKSCQKEGTSPTFEVVLTRPYKTVGMYIMEYYSSPFLLMENNERNHSLHLQVNGHHQSVKVNIFLEIHIVFSNVDSRLVSPLRLVIFVLFCKVYE